MFLLIFITLESVGTSRLLKQSYLSELQKYKDHKHKFVLQNMLLFHMSTTLTVSLVAGSEDTQHLETSEIYIINQEKAKFTGNKNLQNLEHDLHQRCAGVDKTTTKGKIEASKGITVNGVFTAELKLIGFPRVTGDFVVDLRCGVAEFYSVNKITKYLNKKCRLPKTALINAVFCNVLYFPCYVNVETIKMKLIKNDFIEFSGNICNDLSK